MTKESIQRLTHIEHIIKRPDSYVGPTALQTEEYWVRDGEKFVKQNVTFSPAALKIFDEVLVNAIDRNSLHPDEVKYIRVEVDRVTGQITVENNGPLGGISVEEHPTEKLWNPELTFGHLLTSTNYNDSEERVVGGRNGYGAKLVNIYSNNFRVLIQDSENHKQYEQSWELHMSKCNPPSIKSFKGKSSSVTISFTPDWSLFGMKNLTDDFFRIIEKRVYDAAVCTNTKCKVSFQGSPVPTTTLENYARLHLPDDAKIASLTSPRWSVVVANSDCGMNQVSFVNGVCTHKGGTHVDHVLNLVSHALIEKLGKNVKLQPQHVKSHLFVFVKSTLVNPTFSSQVKSECTLKVQNFGSVVEISPGFIQQILKTGIKDDLLNMSKLREQKELKKTDGRRSKITGIPKLDDANFAGTNKSGRCTLIVTEGDSAKSLAIAGLSVVGRDHYGVFPLRGKCKNVREASVKQLLENQEFNDLKKILGLQQEKVYTSLSELRYGRLMIMTDADNDGSHIKGLLLNMIHYFWPSLLKLNFVVSMVTPIIKATRGSQTMSFYTETAFRRWDSTGWKIKYYKGLGTSTSQEAREYFKALDKLTVSFTHDEGTLDSMVLAFDKTKADSRKEWLVHNTEKSPSEREIDYGTTTRVTITDFVHRDLVNFSLADVRRSIAHMCDGLKPSQRKVMYACFAKNLKEEMKVAQLAAYVSEKTAYHHGETSLADTIVKLANDFVGSNNVNLLEPCGQFGTRLMGGKDASQTRYIFTKLTPSARSLFDVRDDPVLNYLDDDGKPIEPEYYVPVLPTVLINGTEGIGTGFSSSVPSFNPKDVRENILRALGGDTIRPMTPWFRGFKGTVVSEEGVWVSKGVYTTTTSGDIHITELPPGRWTQDYKEYLDTLVEKKVISSYTNRSTVETVDFLVSGYTGTGATKDFKLHKTIHTGNMHLFHPTTGIKRYSSPEEILVDFIQVRIKVYKKRKDNLIREITQRKKVIDNKVRFISAVVNEKLVVFKKRKADLEKEMSEIGFERIDDSYDYLLRTATYEYTLEAIVKLNDEQKRLTLELDTLVRTQPLDMWKQDLDK